MTFTVVPAATVTLVGAVADVKGKVKSWEMSCVFVQHTLPSQGVYATIPSMWMVATYCPVPTAETDFTENCGTKDGCDSTHDLWQSFCDTFT